MADTRDLKSLDENRVGSTPTSRTINHKYIDCSYPDPTRYIPGICLNPDGPDRCHKNKCGRPREEHK